MIVYHDAYAAKLPVPASGTGFALKRVHGTNKCGDAYAACVAAVDGVEVVDGHVRQHQHVFKVRAFDLGLFRHGRPRLVCFLLCCVNGAAWVRASLHLPRLGVPSGVFHRHPRASRLCADVR